MTVTVSMNSMRNVCGAKQIYKIVRKQEIQEAVTDILLFLKEERDHTIDKEWSVRKYVH